MILAVQLYEVDDKMRQHHFLHIYSIFNADVTGIADFWIAKIPKAFLP
jgi:hypothetical protein